jgi:hypothetical protein
MFDPESVPRNKRARRHLSRHRDRVILFEAANRTSVLSPGGADLDRGERRETLV